MKKTFTKEDIIKKHQTNVKSATSSFILAGILGLIYIVRYFISENFNFHFSLAFTEWMLRLTDAGSLPKAAAIALVAVYVIIFAVITVLIAKNAKNLIFALCFYAVDALCLVGVGLFHGDSLEPAFFIDVILHLFLFVFLIVGMKSERALRKG